MFYQPLETITVATESFSATFHASECGKEQAQREIEIAQDYSHHGITVRSIECEEYTETECRATTIVFSTGHTLTFDGGEYHPCKPSMEQLPQIAGGSGELVFDLAEEFEAKDEHMDYFWEMTADYGSTIATLLSCMTQHIDRKIAIALEELAAE